MTYFFESQLKQAWPQNAWQRVPVVVAVSGGADSVSLLRGLVSLTGSNQTPLMVGHFDHQLRPDSKCDSDFVRELAKSLGVPVEVGIASESFSGTGSVEQAARTARYRFLQSLARRTGARFIATAHTADDQAETILHRIIRGTGIRGLVGIPFSRELEPGITLVRPMLSIRRSEVLTYLEEIEQPFHDDPTNSEQRFTRNRIRHQLLPDLRRSFNSQVDDALLRLGMQAEEMNGYVERIASEHFAHSVSFMKDNVAVIDLTTTSQVPPLIIRTMLRHIWRTQGWPEQEMTFERWHELERLSGTDGTVILPANIRAESDGRRLVLSKK